jgi:hypothetical protein
MPHIFDVVIGTLRPAALPTVLNYFLVSHSCDVDIRCSLFRCYAQVH